MLRLSERIPAARSAVTGSMPGRTQISCGMLSRQVGSFCCLRMSPTRSRASPIGRTAQIGQHHARQDQCQIEGDDPTRTIEEVASVKHARKNQQHTERAHYETRTDESRAHRRKREADRLNEKTLSRAASVYNLRTSVSDAMNDAVADAKADLRDLRDAAAEIVLSVSSPTRSPSPNALGRHAILGTATPGSASGGSPLKNRRSPHGRSPLAGSPTATLF